MALPSGRVLVLAPYFPDPPTWGAATRVYHLTLQLAQAYGVTFLGYESPDTQAGVGRLQEACEQVHVVRRRPVAGAERRMRQGASVVSPRPFHSTSLQTAAMQYALDKILRSQRFDVVQVEGSPAMCFRYAGDALLVLDEHNIESELLRRQREAERSPFRRVFNGVEMVKYRRHEERAWNEVDACLVTSERERPHLRERAPNTLVRVVPNGVDPEHFAPAACPVDRDRLVFTGLLSYRPNLEGLRWFIDEVLPLVRQTNPKATLTVVGHGTAAEKDSMRAPHVVVTGLVPDVRPYLAKAACVIAPIRMGGGTRLKVVEALAMSKPVVSTTLGCEGLAVVPDRHLLTADDPRDFAAAIVRLLGDPWLGDDLGAAGRCLVLDRYSWRSSGDRLRATYEELMGLDGLAGTVGRPRGRHARLGAPSVDSRQL